MEEVVIEAKHREAIGKQVKALRREGLLPAIIYGRDIEPIPISLTARDATRSLLGVSSSQFVVVNVDGKRHTVLVRERQRHPVSDALLHVDFLEVSMTELLRATVSLVLEGEAPAAKNYGGLVQTGQETLDVECLPKDLPERIEVDISTLEEIGDAIFVRDLVIGSGIEVLTSSDEMVVMITVPSMVEEEEEEEEEIVEILEEPEVIERGKKEEEEEED
jgi:large subunit ribosomal protein L25